MARKRRAKEKSQKQSLVFPCTSCGEEQLLKHGKTNVLYHPYLKTGICRECLMFSYALPMTEDKDGDELYCRWCSDLGKMVYCDVCNVPLCEECIVRNVGAEYYDRLGDTEKWKCFICDPHPITELQELTGDVLSYQYSGNKSARLTQKCSAVFTGVPNITMSEVDDIVRARLRIRQKNYSESLKDLALSIVDAQSDEDDNNKDRDELMIESEECVNDDSDSNESLPDCQLFENKKDKAALPPPSDREECALEINIESEKTPLRKKSRRSMQVVMKKLAILN